MLRPFSCLLSCLAALCIFHFEANATLPNGNKTSMEILINDRTFIVQDDARVVDALLAYRARAPFAVAINGQFVPRAQHATHALRPGDRLDVVQPVTGG